MSLSKVETDRKDLVSFIDLFIGALWLIELKVVTSMPLDIYVHIHVCMHILF